MARRDDYISAGKVAKSMDDKKKGKDKRGGFLRLFFRHPAVVLITISTVLAITIAFTAYMLYSANVQLDYILEQYMALSVKRTDSKSDFNKKLFYVQVDENGVVNITVNLPTGFDKDDEEFADNGEEEEEEIVVPPVAGTSGGNSSGNTNPSSSGVFEKLSQTSGTYNFDGQPLSVMVNNGSTFPAYSGIPSAWGWDENTNATIWHYQNTGSAWINNYKSEIGTNSVSTYQTLNQEFQRSNLSTYNGVKCLQICTTAAIRECGFTPSNTRGVNDTGQNDKNIEGVIIVKDKTTGNYYYIPAYVTDAKAHTYPGGIVQTTCARYSNASAVYDPSDDSCSDYNRPHAALHTSSGHYDYSDRAATVEIEANWTRQPIESNWEIVDVIIRTR